MQYAFILGRVYTLSFAEILAVFERKNIQASIIDLSPEVLIVQTESPIQLIPLQQALGGVIKILRIEDVIKKTSKDSITHALDGYFKPSTLKNKFFINLKGKIHFGLSVYSLDSRQKLLGEPKRVGMMVKRAMQDLGASIRLVLPEFTSLSLPSVSVTNNNLLTKGAEISILVARDMIYVAKTITVQDFVDYGRRDYQRPKRDEKRGMIPPKVAQALVNFAWPEQSVNSPTPPTLLDPMCGVGTIVQEAVLMGARMVGTDIDPHAISASETNLEWFRNRYKISKGRYHIEVSDIAAVNLVLERLTAAQTMQKIDGVATEGYLGPMYGKLPPDAVMEQNFNDLRTIYQTAFKEFIKFLSKGAKIAFCLPAYKLDQHNYQLFPNLDFITDLGYSLKVYIPQEIIENYDFFHVSERNTVIYDRKDQIVAREIVVFEKL